MKITPKKVFVVILLLLLLRGCPQQKKVAPQVPAEEYKQQMEQSVEITEEVTQEPVFEYEPPPEEYPELQVEYNPALDEPINPILYEEEPVIHTYILTAKWCSVCQKMKKDEYPILKRSGWLFKEKDNEAYHICELDYDEEDSRKSVEKYKVPTEKLPVIIKFDSANRKVLKYHVGYMTAKQIADFNNSK